MSILNFWKRDDSPTDESQESSSLTTEPEVDDVILKALLSNEPITRENAMTIPAVSGAVDFISNTIAAMPVKLYKYKTDGHVEEKYDDSRVRILNGDTGDTLDAFQMKKAMVEDYLMGRGGYAYIKRYRNEVTGLYYVQDQYVSVLINANPIFKERKLMVYDAEYELHEFIKLLRRTSDGASSVGLTNEVSKALQTAFATILYQLTTARNGGAKKGFLKSQRKLGQNEINVLKQAWRNLYSSENSDNVVVLNNGLEFQEASNSLVEMQLDQNKKTLTNEINNIFHIYPEDYYRTFKEAIYPIIRAFETALDRDFLLEREKKSHFFEFDVKEALRVDIKERYEAYKLAKETGFMTLNEIRKAENMDTVEGMDVVNVGLASVLYDTTLHKYYTPNTGVVEDITDVENGVTQTGVKPNKEQDKVANEIEDHEILSEAEKDGEIM